MPYSVHQLQSHHPNNRKIDARAHLVYVGVQGPFSQDKTKFWEYSVPQTHFSYIPLALYRELHVCW